MQRKEKRTALLAGATGLVGREILRLLSNDDRIAEVRALVRRSLPIVDKGPRVRELITDFEHLHLRDHPEWFEAELVFSALGTTIAQAGTREAFRRVDLEYPLAIAKAARARGAQHFLFVSALGANPRSLFFYTRIKGELEEAILALGYPSVTIVRPSLLLGNRQERRFTEELAKRFAWLYPSPWAPIQASQVAAVLARAGFEGRPGVQILDNKRLHVFS